MQTFVRFIFRKILEKWVLVELSWTFGGGVSFFLSSDCGFRSGLDYFFKSITLSVVRQGESRGQPWHVIMACHFSSTFPTMHDPDWSQNTHLGADTLHRNTSLGSEGRPAS